MNLADRLVVRISPVTGDLCRLTMREFEILQKVNTQRCVRLLYCMLSSTKQEHDG
jgi:hypothetical protein